MSKELENITFINKAEMPEIVYVQGARQIKYSPWKLFVTKLRVFTKCVKETVKQYIKR